MPNLPRPPIATRLLKAFKSARQGNVVSLDAIRQVRASTEKISAVILPPEELQHLHPAHALYVASINHMSVMVELLTQLPELDKLSSLVGAAEDEYMPSAPPMSPISKSFFMMWAFFDAWVGKHRETFGSVMWELRDHFGMAPELVSLFELWCQSRMGLYVLEENSGDTVLLRELVLNRTLRCIVPSGYKGELGRVWFVRVMPPPTPAFEEHVVITTPYDVNMPGEAGWLKYLNRTLPQSNRQQAYEQLLKWGPSPEYWSEYIFCAYSDYQTEAIHLVGIPDVPASLPHSDLNVRYDGEPLHRYVRSGKMLTGDPA